MSVLRPAIVVASVVLLGLGCAGQQRLQRIQAMSDDSKELFSKYRQFMTEGQQEEFIALPTYAEHRAYVDALHVEERLEKYPEYIRKAIWSQDVVPGMDRGAVLLSWGTPYLREFDEHELARGNEVERWSYRHGANDWVQVVIANGVVTAVQRPEQKR